MELTSILRHEAVRIVSNSSSKKRLFQAICEAGCDAYGLCSKSAVEALQERENLGPTGVGKGIAIPHARLPALEGVNGVFIRLEKPLEFSSVDRQPVDLIFALFAPENSGVDHLKALALVSRTLRDPNTCAKLRANTDASTLYTILTEAPVSKAA
jgi:PTS system nitrogen regulatory IIA component